MKKLLAFLLFLTLVPLHAYERPEDGPMTAAQALLLRFEAVTVLIIDVNDRALSKKAKAHYEAILNNPFTRGIICNIELTSSLGLEVIESKSHYNIYASARSTHKVKGEIKIKRGKKDDDGLQWIEARGSSVAARSCRFID